MSSVVSDATATSTPIPGKTLPKRPWQPYVTPWEKIAAGPYRGSGTDQDPYLVDWLKEDPEDPQRFPPFWKWMQVFVTAVANLAVALASTAYNGGVLSMIMTMGYSLLFWTGGVALFVLGFAFGPLLWAPASEVFGRRPIYLLCYAFLTLWLGVCAAATNGASVLVFRFLAGFFGSAPLANAGGTLADVLDGNQIGLGMALFSVAPFLGPAIGPIAGGFLGDAAGWRWVTGFLAIFCGVVTVMLFLWSGETYAPILLRQRAQRLSNATGKVYRYRPDATTPFNVKKLFAQSLSRPWKFLFLEPIVLILSIYIALIYGILYLNFAGFPVIFQEGRGWSSGMQGLAFLGLTVGSLLAVFIVIVWIEPRYLATVRKRGYPLPEDRLRPARWASVLAVIGLAGFAATCHADVHWTASIIFGVPFGLSMVILFLTILGYLVDSYTVYAASVLAANAVLRSLFGAAFPMFTRTMYMNLGVNWASAVPGFMALVCVPFPFLFYKYGARIRAKCKYASEAQRLFAQIMAARKAAMMDEEKNAAAPERPASMNLEEQMDEQTQRLQRTVSMEMWDLQRSVSTQMEATSPKTRFGLLAPGNHSNGAGANGP